MRLKATKEYKQMRRDKGTAEENWNWQTWESNYGAEPVSSEYEIISNYHGSESDGEQEKNRMIPGKDLKRKLSQSMKKKF
jgi:hypothetical protein